MVFALDSLFLLLLNVLCGLLFLSFHSLDCVHLLTVCVWIHQMLRLFVRDL